MSTIPANKEKALNRLPERRNTDFTGQIDYVSVSVNRFTIERKFPKKK